MNSVLLCVVLLGVKILLNLVWLNKIGGFNYNTFNKTTTKPPNQPYIG